MKMWIAVSAIADGDQTPNRVHYISRQMKFGKDPELMNTLAEAVTDKYGEPKRSSRTADGPLAGVRSDYSVEGLHGKTKRADVFLMWPEGYWVLDESINDFEGEDYRLNRFADCEQKAKAQGAKKIIPD